MIKKRLLTKLLIINSALGCEVFFKKNIIINDLERSYEWSDLKNSCSTQEINSISNSLRLFQGNVPTALIKSRLNTKGINVQTKHKSITIYTISTLIKKSPIFREQKIKKISFESGLPNINSNSKELLLNPYSIELKTDNNYFKSPLTYEAEKAVFVAIKNITPMRNSNLMEHITLQKKWINSTNINEYLYSKNEVQQFLRFYKNTRFIKNNQLIKKNMFQKKNILSFGQPVKVLFQNKNLRIKTTGLPQSNGGIQDTVFIRLNNNKLISAEVIDKGVVRANL